MKARFEALMEALGSSMWFLPSVLALLAVAAAFGLIELDRRIEPQATGVAGLIFHGGPEGARAVLSAVASSMMTVTGVTFSITVVALTLASQQYTPRVLRHFASDRGNQCVLGTFIGTFIYSLLVLRTVRADSMGLFVPHLAVTGGVLLAVASLALLIYFIHHIAAMIQPSTIIERVAESTAELIDHLFPERLGNEATEAEATATSFRQETRPGTTIPAGRSGYLRVVDLEGLMAFAQDAGGVIRMECAVGDYVSRDATLVTIWPQGFDSQQLQRVHGCFVLGRDRTMQQDPAYGVLQLSDIAVKALSPGINDPTTAITCLDFLGSLLEQLAQRHTPSDLRKDEEGQLRVIARGISFAGLADLAFSQIRHYGEQDAAVTKHLLRTLTRLAAVVQNVPEHCEVLRCHLEEIRAGMERGIQSVAQRRQIRQLLQEAECALGSTAGAGSREE